MYSVFCLSRVLTGVTLHSSPWSGTLYGPLAGDSQECHTLQPVLDSRPESWKEQRSRYQ